MNGPENWNEDKQDEVIESGRRRGVAWMRDELKGLSDSYIEGHTSHFDELLEGISSSKLDVEPAEGTQQWLENWGFALGKQQSKIILSVIYGKAGPTKPERMKTITSAIHDLEMLIEKKFEWPEINGWDIFGIDRADAASGIPKLDRELLASYKNGKPENSNFWDIQAKIAAVQAETTNEVNEADLVQKLQSRGLENEAIHLPLFAAKAKDVKPWLVLYAMSLSWQRFDIQGAQ